MCFNTNKDNPVSISLSIQYSGDSNVSNKDFTSVTNSSFHQKENKNIQLLALALFSKHLVFLSFQMVHQIVADMVHHHLFCSFDIPFLYQLLDKSMVHLDYVTRTLQNCCHTRVRPFKNVLLLEDQTRTQ